jgi:hypothetical protein
MMIRGRMGRPRENLVGRGRSFRMSGTIDPRVSGGAEKDAAEIARRPRSCDRDAWLATHGADARVAGAARPPTRLRCPTMSYKPIMRVRSHALIVEDARLAEKAQYEQVADELDLGRQAGEVRKAGQVRKAGEARKAGRARKGRGEFAIGDRLRSLLWRGAT